MNLRKQFIFLFLLSCFSLCAQRYSATIIDSETKYSIPYATVQYGDDLGTITNENGEFSFHLGRTVAPLDSVYVSCMGYGKSAFTYSELAKDTLQLHAKSLELVGVELVGQGLTAEEIVERMKIQVPDNYQTLPVQKRFFLRQSTNDKIERAELKLVSSSIDRINQLLLDSITKALPKKSEYHTETLGELYKKQDSIKLIVTKAAELYDLENQATFEALGGRLENIIKKHTKSDSYFKIKTGPISSKYQFNNGPNSILKDGKNDIELKKLTQRNFISKRKERLRLIETQVFGKKSRLDVISKSNRYIFTLQNTIKTSENNRQYIISFAPKKYAALNGKLYINTDDFALTRIEYTNEKPIKPLKLLGVHYEETLYKGVAVYSKMNNGKYELTFSKLSHNQYLNAERPLKIVEKNKNTKGRRQQNEIVLELYYTSKNEHTFEWVAFERKGSSEAAFNKLPDNSTTELTYLSKYEPNFWEGHTIIEPNEAIKSFEATSTN
ncbi:hypothetical protein [Croceitalea vernalis]|uniref:Carboxypeptidase-like regulatory domain-containing protein n=1 Tax=Croceitalea vernalis TaxID=3075599 RepID=A0ABU3BJN2_9FLAO|nr:hypothetical protein [Croceitalea sp. P007]MDT0622361.1 hypothetical protein [Croceitalea sp. P007]